MTESKVIFDLAALVRPPAVFRDADGTEYAFLSPDEFGLVEAAQFRKADQERMDAYARYQADDTDVDAARENRAALNAQIAVLLPMLPVERREALGDLTKLQLITNWNNQRVVPISAEAATGPASATTSANSAPTSAAITPATHKRAS